MADNSRTIRNSDAGPGGGRTPADGGYRDADDDNTGGISNRPFDEEQNNQQALPERGEAQPEPGTEADDEWVGERSDR